MARKSTTNTATDTATAETAVAENSVAENEDVKTMKTKRNTRKSVELDDSEEIEVISLIPHVSYKDKRTEDMYEWEQAGHSEFMTVETLKDMWRNNKGYFRNLWLKPLDDRILVKFGLVKLFENYEFLMEESSYTKDNLEKLTTAIVTIPVGMKFAVVNKIKELVSTGKISDINVIKALGNKLDTDFIAFS